LRWGGWDGESTLQNPDQEWGGETKEKKYCAAASVERLTINIEENKKTSQKGCVAKGDMNMDQPYKNHIGGASKSRKSVGVMEDRATPPSERSY